VQLTVVEMGDRMVPRMMGPTAGGMIKDWCQAKGLRVLTGTRVTAIEPGVPLKVTLSNGDTLECELVISATGVKPNIGFLQGSGIGCEIGVLTNERMQSNVAEVYAAGDCAQALDLPSGKALVSAIQPNAADQARVAAQNMLGRRATLPQVTQINVLDTLGLISASFGDWEGVPGGEQAELTDRAAGKHLSLQFGSDTLVGINSVGWTEHVGVMRGLVEGHVSLGDWKPRLMRDPTLLMEAYLARAQAQQVQALVKS
jgi:NADPH-dependent 2,4-dienoyl-CoA reductase/sulfur reductase-like enzyme